MSPATQSAPKRAFSPMAAALLLALRQVDYLAGGDAERFSTAQVIADGWAALEAHGGTQEAALRQPLVQALRELEAFERDTPLPERDGDVVDAGLVALLEAGYPPELLCEDTQFDRAAPPGIGTAP